MVFLSCGGGFRRGDTTSAAKLVVTTWTELFFFFFSSCCGGERGKHQPLPTYKPAIRLFNLETWSFFFFLSSRWWHSAKIYGQEAIGCGPHLEFLYKVALLIERETALSSEENSACCLTGCCLPLDLTTCDKKKQQKNIQMKKILLFKNVVLL